MFNNNAKLWWLEVTMMDFVIVAGFFVLVLLVFLLLLPIFTLLWLWRYCMDRIVMSDIGGQGEICKPADAFYLSDAPKYNYNSALLSMLRGCPNIDQAREDVLKKFVFAKDENGLRLFPKATRYITYKRGRPVWMDDPEFDIKDHVFTWEDNPPKTEQGIRDLVGKLISEPLPENKARWQFILVPCTISDKLSHVIFRWHHSVGDGLAIVNFFARQFGVGPTDTSNIETVKYSPQICKAVRALLFGIYKLVKNSLTPIEANIIQEVELSRSKLVAWSKGYKVKFFKRMKSAGVAKMTVNDILMTAVTGSVRKYFKSHTIKIPNDSLCLLAVSLRKPGNKIELDNDLTGVAFPLPTHMNDPLKIIEEVKKRIEELKYSQYTVARFLQREILPLLPKWTLPSVLRYHNRKLTLSYSNVPPQEAHLRFAGKDVENVIGFLSTSVAGLTFLATTYSDEVTMAIIVDSNLQVDPSVFVKGFEETLSELAEQLGVVEDGLEDKQH